MWAAWLAATCGLVAVGGTLVCVSRARASHRYHPPTPASMPREWTCTACGWECWCRNPTDLQANIIGHLATSEHQRNAEAETT